LPKDDLLPVIGKGTAGLIEILRVFVDQEETLIISGPTGAGKSRLARWCHEQSRRKPHPFETLDLLSVPEDLQMAELVGWKRGAFTGATNSMPGALTRAAKGTLFIDEIDKLSLKAQSGLLRMIEERRYRALGDDTNERQVEARFIIGTNADLRALVRNGRFREDLYYRIHVLPVRLPPLAERLDEVPEWAAFMLERCSGHAKGSVHLTPDAIQALLSHSWPGNLRQLDNVIRRAYAFALAGRERDVAGVSSRWSGGMSSVRWRSKKWTVIRTR
jgi:DNA-binding NtrC family response regulator